MVSIYSQAVIAEARRCGITELQAYRKLQAKEAILRLGTVNNLSNRRKPFHT